VRQQPNPEVDQDHHSFAWIPTTKKTDQRAMVWATCYDLCRDGAGVLNPRGFARLRGMRRLQPVSFLEITLSLVGWAFLLGLAGAILAIPLTLGLKKLILKTSGEEQLTTCSATHAV
jgi:hypothetical protein